jgi:hypothetical protein
MPLHFLMGADGQVNAAGSPELLARKPIDS